jgi:hypothetical protein
MTTISILNLEKLDLRFPRAKVRGTATAQICVSSHIHNGTYRELRNLEHVWVRRRQNVRVELSCKINGKQVESGLRRQIEDALRDAKVRFTTSRW